jgi:hypothetical protein
MKLIGFKGRVVTDVNARPLAGFRVSISGKDLLGVDHELVSTSTAGNGTFSTLFSYFDLAGAGSSFTLRAFDPVGRLVFMSATSDLVDMPFQLNDIEQIRDVDGSAAPWNLIGRLQVGEPLPALGPVGRGGMAAITYLKRQEIWQQLKAEAAAFGEALVPYSLRHRYSYEGHRIGITAKDLSQAMGHSLECHLRAYARFTSNETAQAFAAATARVEAGLAGASLQMDPSPRG